MMFTDTRPYRYEEDCVVVGQKVVRRIGTTPR
jgi:hypothetical protein